MYYIYLMTNQNNTVLYTGVTNDLQRRIYEHKNGITKGFTSVYNVNKLVYFEQFHDINEAIKREKQIKGWTRAKKNTLVNIENAEWRDLSAEWFNMSF